jgi:hypothetical protein
MRIALIAGMAGVFMSCAGDPVEPPRPATDAADADLAEAAGDVTAETTPAGPCACSGSYNDRLAFPLECHCGASSLKASTLSCATTRETFQAEACGSGAAAVVQMTGCGKISLMASGGFSGINATYDQISGQLLGVTAYADVGFGTCTAAEYRFGQSLRPGFECAASQMQFCLLCGNPALLAHGSNVNLPPPPLPVCP